MVSPQVRQLLDDQFKLPLYDKGGAVYNMKHPYFGLKGNGTAEGSAVQAALDEIPTGSRIYWPKGTYNLGSTSVNLAGKMFYMIGENPSHPSLSASTKIYGSVNGPLFYATPGSGLYMGFGFHRLWLQNDHNAGTVLRFADTIAPFSVTECTVVSNYNGILLPQNTFTNYIVNTRFIGSGNPSGSIGFFTGGHTTVLNCDVVGFDNGVRASGVGLFLAGCRIEVNLVGIRAGIDYNGNPLALSSFEIAGSTFEANDYGLYLTNTCNNGKISGISIQGSTNAPAGDSIDGINLASGNGIGVESVSAVGTFTGYAVNLSGIVNSYAFTTFENVQAINSGSGGAWSIGADRGVSFENCNIGQVETTFPNTDTTPSTYLSTNGGRQLFLASNSAPTTITDFGDGLTGIPIRIRATNGNTTIQHGTNIFLKSGANKTLAAGEAITFTQYSDGYWYET